MTHRRGRPRRQPLEVGRRIKEAIEARGCTHQDAADAAGIDRTTLTNYVNGKRNPPDDVLERLATFLGPSAEWLRNGPTVEESSATNIRETIRGQVRALRPDFSDREIVDHLESNEHMLGWLVQETINRTLRSRAAGEPVQSTTITGMLAGWENGERLSSEEYAELTERGLSQKDVVRATRRHETVGPNPIADGRHVDPPVDTHLANSGHPFAEVPRVV